MSIFVIQKCNTNVINMNKKCIIDIETNSLNPTQGRIICIGIKDVFSDETRVFYNENEKTMVEEFLDYFHEKQFNEIIGYNVLFDIRFIFAKCLKYGIKTNGFFKSEFNDLMATMKSVKKIWSMNTPGTLEQWTKYIFGESKLEITAFVPEMYERGEIQRILDYNKKDLALTFKLWKRVEEILWN